LFWASDALLLITQENYNDYQRQGHNSSTTANNKKSYEMKVKLSLWLANYHAMKTYGIVEVQFHAFLSPALDRGRKLFNAET